MQRGRVLRVLSGLTSIFAPVFCLMKIGFEIDLSPPVGLFNIVSAEAMMRFPSRSKLIVKKSSRRRSPPWKFGFAVQFVPLKQILLSWIGRPEAFVTESCGSTNFLEPSEHVSVLPWAFRV